MIGKLSGRLDWRGTDQVLMDVRGVGYIVHVSDRTLAGLPGVGEAVSLYTELMVREDLLQLFGFPTMLEKEWHKLLTTVQGVGAKAAMAILGTLGPEGTARAITLGDARAVQAAPGVGPKLAQRLVSLHSQLTEVLRTYAPDAAAVEHTFVNKDAVATLKLGQARGIALLVPAQAGIEVGEYAPNAVKKTVVGVGHAAKVQVDHMVRLHLPGVQIAGPDAADALAVAICHAHHLQSSTRLQDALRRAAG